MSEQEYSKLIKNQPPQQAFLAWEAQQRGRSLVEMKAADASLSTARDPYNRSDRDAVAMGRAIYLVHCADCHGEHADGKGPMAAPNSTRMSFDNPHKRAYIELFGHAPNNWYPSIASGPAGNAALTDESFKMPAFERVLAREQIWLLITYLEQETLHPGQTSSTK